MSRETKNPRTLGLIIKDLGFSQDDLSLMSGVSQGAISKYIMGETSPNLAMAARICFALKMSIYEVFPEIFKETREIMSPSKGSSNSDKHNN